MRIILSGATGFIGSAFLRGLVSHGHEVSIIVRDSSDPWRIEDMLPDVAMLRADMSDRDALLHAADKIQADAVAHVAWHGVPGRHKDDDEQFTANIPVMQNMLELAANVGSTTFMALGSQAEYGRVEGKVSEDHALEPVTKYGRAKCEVLGLAQEACSSRGARFLWFRLFSLYGPGEREPWLIPFLVRSLLQEGGCSLSSCEQIRDYVYVDDAAQAFLGALQGEVSGIFNVGQGEGVVLRELVERVRQLACADGDLRFGELEQRSDQPHELVADISKIQHALGWQPEVDLETGLKETVSSLVDEYERPV